MKVPTRTIAPDFGEGTQDFRAGRMTFASDKFIRFAKDFLMPKKKRNDGTVPAAAELASPTPSFFPSGSQER